MERNFLKRKVFRLNRPVAAKTGFPPFARRSLPPATPGFQSGLQARSCAEAHTKKNGFCASKSRSMRKHASIRAASPAVRGSAQFTVLNTKNLCSAGSGILQQSAVQFLFLAQAKYLQFSDRSKVFYHLCVLQEFFPIPP